MEAAGLTGWLPALDPLATAAATGMVALTFIRALIHKIGDFDGFRQSVEDYRLLPASLSLPTALLLTLIEALLLVALLLPWTRLEGAAIAAIMLALYAGAMAINLLRGRHSIDCGCGGVGQPVSWGLIGRNGALIATAALAALPVTPRALGVLDMVAVPVMVAASWLVLLIVEQLVRTFAHMRALAERGQD